MSETRAPYHADDPYAAARAEHRRRTMDLTELAEVLGIGETLCRDAAKQGTLPVTAFQIGSRWLVSRAEVDAKFPAHAADVPMPERPATDALSLLIGLRDLADLAIAAMQARQASEQVDERVAS